MSNIPATAPNTAPTPIPSLEGLKVLVVDDEFDCRRMIASVLQTCGAKVTTTGGFAEALEQLTLHHFDVLISDIEMPIKDGYALIRWIRHVSTQRHIPAAALTGHDTQEEFEKALRAGFQMHISKPIEMAYLAAAVADLAVMGHKK